MATRDGSAQWRGDLKSGSGTVTVASGLFDGRYSFSTRFEDGAGTNPEELIGAAHASCYAMALSGVLTEAGHAPDSVRATAKVHLRFIDGAPTISQIDLVAQGRVPGYRSGPVRRFRRTGEGRLPHLTRARRGRGDHARSDARQLRTTPAPARTAAGAGHTADERRLSGTTGGVCLAVVRSGRSLSERRASGAAGDAHARARAPADTSPRRRPGHRPRTAVRAASASDGASVAARRRRAAEAARRRPDRRWRSARGRS